MNRLQRRWTRRLQRLESVLQYIESHSGDPIEVSALAAMASISPFHFHRVFSTHIGEPVLAYIRRLRLEKAAYRLLFMSRTVTEVATQAGYSSSAAFTRAFRAHFGATPKKFIRTMAERRARETAPVPSEPEFRRVAPFDVIGVKRRGSCERAPSEAWAALRAFLGAASDGGRPWVRIGVPLDCPDLTPEARLRYEACVVSDRAPEGEFFRKRLGGGTYAVFAHRGSFRDLQAAHEAIIWHWVPRSGVWLRDGPAFHLYRDDGPDSADPGRVRAEIHIPVEPPQPARTAPRVRPDAVPA
jgi:AraC family transcriptional regulator